MGKVIAVSNQKGGVAYQEWANVIALVVIAVIVFTVLFAGTFIQVLLEEANSGLRKIIRA